MRKAIPVNKAGATLHPWLDRQRLWQLSGPVLTALLILALVGLSGAGLHVPNPLSPLQLLVVFAAFSGGLRAGLACAALAWTFCLCYFAEPGALFTYTDDNRALVLSQGFLMPATAIIVGTLHGRLQRLVQGQAARSSELADANQRLQAEIAERQHAEEVLRIRERQQASVAELGLLALRGTEIDEVFSAAVQAVETNLGAHYVRVFELETEGDGFRMVPATGEPTSGPATIGGDSLAGFTIRSDSPVISEDLEAETRFRPPRSFEGRILRSALSTVIMGRKQPYGVLSAYTSEQRTFTPDDISFVQAVANVLAMVVERDRVDEDLRTRDDQLRQAQKMESIGRLAGGIAHDFNNLLTAMLGFTELVVNTLDADDYRRGYLEQVQHSGERATWLINQLLSFSRQEPLNPVVLDLNHTVGEMAKLLQRVLGQKVRLSTVIGAPEAYIEADLGQVEQIILNLATNARDAMPQGGELRIETGETYLDTSYVSHHLEIATGPYVTLTASDTGLGMDEKTRAHIFEPFFTTKGTGEGTGLGLATVYSIVRQAGGDIIVESAPGRGTTFSIYLPKRAAPDLSPEEETASPGGVRGTETILLVEDEPGVRALAAAVMQSLGYTVMVADNGHDALVQAVRASQPLDLLITDMVMPGLSGLELAQQMVERYPSLRVLFMSGFSPDLAIGQQSLREGSAFLKKPFAPLQLARKVRELLDSTEPARLPSDPRAPIGQ